MVFIIAFKTYSWTQREEVEEMARKQMRYGLIIRRNKEGNTSDEIIIIHSNWEKMLAYKMIREIGNSVEDETVLYHLLEETINRIKRYAEVEVCQLGEREPIAIKLYESIIENIKTRPIIIPIFNFFSFLFFILLSFLAYIIYAPSFRPFESSPM